MIGLEGRTLKSQRLTYRLLDEADKGALHEILSDKSVTEPAGFMPAETEAGFDEFFDGLTRYDTGIAILRDGALIGYIHVNKYVPELPEYNGKKCVSTGFVIGKEYQNQGYASETLGTVTLYLKQSFDFCFADHFEGNEPSRRVIEKCGYRYFDRYTMFFDGLGKEMTCLSYVY